MGAIDPGVKRLLRAAGALLKSISGMTAQYPLKPVFGGLPRADQQSRIIDEPASYDEEERHIVALREPLSQFLKDAKRFVTDLGTARQKQRFSENTLVEVSFFNGPPGRRGYSKTDCLADLRSLQHLLEEVANEPARQDVDRPQRLAVAGITTEPHFSVKELATQWGLSERTIRRLIEDEPDVIAIHKNSRLRRTYRRVQIPASVAERIHRKIRRRER